MKKLSEKKTLNFEGKKLKYYKTFNLFGEVAYIAKCKLPNYKNEYWEVFLQKRGGDFGRMGTLSSTAKNAVKEAINKVKSYAKLENVTHEQLMTSILK
jgi:hypothetical protein